MKLFILLLAALAFFGQELSAQASSTLIKSFANPSKNPVVLAFNGQVELSEWDEPHIRITTHIEIENFDEALLKRLITAGRYHIHSEEQPGLMTFSIPKLERIVRIQNVELKEVLSYKVQIPKGQSVEIKSPAGASF